MNDKPLPHSHQSVINTTSIPHWSHSQDYSTPPAFYDEHQRHQIDHQQAFDMTTVRAAAPQMMPPFLPSFGLPIAEFDYRINDIQRSSLFGSCHFGTPLPSHPLAHTFSLTTSIHSTPVSIAMEGLQLPPPPPPPPILQNQTSVIQRAPPVELSISEKPPILSAEFPIKIEDELMSKTVSPSQKSLIFENSTASQTRSFCMKDDFKPSLFDNKTILQTKEDFFFGSQFYPNTVPIDMTSNALKQEMSSPSTNEQNVDFSRTQSSMFLKKDYSPLHDCQVCLSTHANGLHFGARTCAACAAFFRRTISDDKRYVCKRNQRCHNASRDGTGYRKICRSCRMKRCLEIGMLPENVQHKRSRRDHTPPPRKHPFNNFFPGFYPSIQSTH